MSKVYWYLSAALFLIVFNLACASSLSSSINASVSSSTITPSTTPSMSSSISVNQSTSSIPTTPTPTSTQSTSSTINNAQVNGGGPNKGIGYSDIPLPPLDERRDFDLIAHTRMKWIGYLLDETGAEFIYMSKLIEKTFNELFKNVPGFIKTKLTEFMEKDVTFLLIIYTKKEAHAETKQLFNLVEGYTNSGEDRFKIFDYEVKPRFQTLPPDTRIKPAYVPSTRAPDEANHFLNFATGFGVAIGMVAVFTIVGVIKYKISLALKSKQSDRQALNGGVDNEGLEN